MKKDVSNIIDKIVADVSKSIVDTAASVSKDYLAADTSLKNYVDKENIKINQKIDNISSNFLVSKKSFPFLLRSTFTFLLSIEILLPAKIAFVIGCLYDI